MSATVVSVVGREEELRAARTLLEESQTAVVVFRGEPGIGKTTVWEAVVAAAAASGRRILAARPVEAERRLALAAFADLLEPVAEEVLPELPDPQRRALEAALLLAEAETAPDPRTLGAALVGALRVLGGDNGALLAVDDLHWTDAASRVAVDFALRRLTTARASAVLAVRSGNASEAMPLFDAQATSCVVDVAPLSLGAVQRLISDRIGVTLPRPLLRRLHQTSGGNPFYALEIAYALRDAGPSRVGEDLPLPSNLEDALRKRIAGMPPRTRSALAAAAALAEPRVGLIGDEGDLEPALHSGLVRLERGVVRFTHPLLASVAYTRLASGQRQALHARLATVVEDVEQQARHRALAHPGRDESVAVTLEAAADRALARGAPVGAGELLEMAVMHTEHRERRARRSTAAAQAYWRAGEKAAARPLVQNAVRDLDAGAERARALVLLSAVQRDLRQACVFARRAWSEAKGDSAAEARAAAALSILSGFSGDLADALDFAQKALARADDLPDATLAAVVADAEFMRLTGTGRVDLEAIARGLEAEERAGGVTEGREVRQTLAIQLLMEERYAEARAELEKAIAVVEVHGHENRLQDLLNILSEVETRSGRPRDGAAIAARAAEIRERLGPDPSDILSGYFSALASAYLGQVDEVRALTAAGLAAAAESGNTAFEVQHAATLGFLEFSLGNAEAALKTLEPTVERLAALAPGIHPMHAPVLPNLIEALIAVGRIDEALVHVDRLEKRGRELDSAWALSQAARARGLVAAARGNLTDSLEWFDKAFREHERTGPFERARTLLAHGTVLRRARQWRAARDSLNAALALFEEIEATLWVQKARAELERIGGRSAADGLTPTEQRIAQLVAAGLSNKEIANELFVTVRTVETHLTKVYSKLAVRSRTELVTHLSA